MMMMMAASMGIVIPGAAALKSGVTKALRRVTCSIPANSLTAVVGSVGSGKTSLLLALIGERLYKTHE